MSGLAEATVRRTLVRLQQRGLVRFLRHASTADRRHPSLAAHIPGTGTPGGG